MKTQISRRDFLRGTMAAAITASTAGILGACGLQTETPAETDAGTEAADTAASGTETVPVSAEVEEAVTWRTAPDDIPDSDIVNTQEADIVIVGAGPAGIAAARSALEEGASVIVLEAQEEDMYSVYPSEVGHINSAFGISKGAPEYDPMDLTHDLLRRNANRINPTLARTFAYESGETVDWLLEDFDEELKSKIDITFVNPPKYYKGEAYGYKSFIGTLFFRTNNGVEFMDLIQHNIGKIRSLGGEIRFGAKAYKLTKEGDTVTGVVAKSDAGYEKFIAKKTVILAAGDFGGNHEMVVDLVPELNNLLQEDMDSFLCFGRNGSGIQLGVWAGGRIDPAPVAPLMGGVVKPGTAGPLGDTAVCYLNKYGKRYCAEGFGHINQALRQPKGNLYAVWDSHWAEQLEYQPYDHGNVDLHYHDDFNLNRLKTEMAALELGNPEGGPVHECAKTEPEECTVYAAETLEELADLLGFEGEYKQNFLDSIERYNGFCHDGFDADFGKDEDQLFPVEDGPFYGYKSPNNNGFALCVCTGLYVNEQNQVLDKEGVPIPGLMAVGNNAGGSFALNYATPMSGCCCGTAVTLGRYCGRNAAAL